MYSVLDMNNACSFCYILVKTQCFFIKRLYNKIKVLYNIAVESFQLQRRVFDCSGRSLTLAKDLNCSGGFSTAAEGFEKLARYM